MSSDDIKATAKDIGERIGQTSADATASARGAAMRTGNVARDFATQTSDNVSELYSRAQDHIRDAADRLPDQASDAMAAGQRAYKQGSESVARQISKQPIEALLLAAAIGYLVGWATNRS